MWWLFKMNCFIFRSNLSQSPIHKQAIRVISVFSVQKANVKPWSQVPGPKSYPIIASSLSFLPGGELYNLDFIRLMRELNVKYGPIVKLHTLLTKKPMLILYDAESVAQILRRENSTPIRLSVNSSLTDYRKQTRPPGSPIGLLGVHGKQWQKFRSTVNPVLMQPKTMRLYTSAIDEVALDMVHRLKSLRNTNNMIPNIDQHIELWSLESLGVIALGCRMNCLKEKPDRDSPAQQLIEVVQNILKSINNANIMRPSIWKYFQNDKHESTMDYYKKLEILARYFIDQAIKEFKLNPKPDDQKGVLEKLLEINKEVALIMVTDMLFGGIDTTTHAVLGALYLLASNPDKQSKLRAELNTNDVKRPYLKACVKEALRRMPVIAGNMRETTKEYSILCYKIPKGISVLLAHQNMSLADEYFVKPYDYTPERWIVDKDDPLYYKNGHPFAYGPFGFGARSCIGRRIAELEIETFIGRVIENFEMKWFGPPPKIVSKSINFVTEPFNFVFTDAVRN